MHEQERVSLGVLGALVAWLALAALATHPQPLGQDRGAGEGDPAVARGQRSSDTREKKDPSLAALTALRDGKLVDLNAATTSDLELLPGIGPRLAERIIEHRTRCGGAFRSLEQVREVSGIGPAKLAALRKTTCVEACVR
jgi:competence ComEA-like helix-hairpin-helix protein